VVKMVLEMGSVLVMDYLFAVLIMARGSCFR